jgi:GNAT superfamily N-acetyltransferase
MKFLIRKGEIRDMKYVLSLIKELAIFEKEPEAVNITVEDLIQNGFKDKPAFRTFIAEYEDKIVGMVLFYDRFSTWDGPSIHIEDLIVNQKFRRNGIGKLLYNSVLEYAINAGVKRVEWVVLDWNLPAIDFYKNSGATILENWNLCQINDKSIDLYLSR